MSLIVSAIEDGLTFALAAGCAGITYQTFNEWRKEFSEFSEAVEKAASASMRWHMRNIRLHAQDDWRASAWMAEHRFPAEYGKVIQEQKHSGDITVNLRYTNDWRGKRPAESEAAE